MTWQVLSFPPMGLKVPASLAKTTKRSKARGGSGGTVSRCFEPNASAAPHDDGRCWALTPVGWKGRGFRTASLGERARTGLPKVHGRHTSQKHSA